MCHEKVVSSLSNGTNDVSVKMISILASMSGYFYNLDPDPGPGPGLWTRSLDPDPRLGPWTRTLKTWTLKTWTLKNLDPAKPGP